MANHAEETSSPPTSTKATRIAVPGQLLPTTEALLELREKFLSVYDVASILESKSLPWYCIHRDFYKLDASRAPTGPIPGNDYHAKDPRIHADPAAWAGTLRFDPSHRSTAAGTQISGPLIVPFKHIEDHPDLVAGGNKSLDEVAALIRDLWPDVEIGPPTYPFKRTQLTDTNAPEYRVFHWISSKRLNSEIVDVQPFSRTPHGQFLDTQRLHEFVLPSEVRLHGEPFSHAQI
ncbi:hypothetical protein TOPH_08800 [Tolypocladium ophioglossoides CBS 100239]|uniref:Uncharacterized protein n=1 Tax=Tolypocladium ophioglossoides (strain CBS 100239) TaxID=1163406 RepID=A0A0L0MXE2_TOLOC|nr:hypothetical protein TOPH_08800 [Tolypocladium ophioglossoides CBS 100239]